MVARKAAYVICWPFLALAWVLEQTGRYLGYLFIAMFPPALAFWLMKHASDHKREEQQP